MHQRVIARPHLWCEKFEHSVELAGHDDRKSERGPQSALRSNPRPVERTVLSHVLYPIRRGVVPHSSQQSPLAHLKAAAAREAQLREVSSARIGDVPHVETAQLLL